MTKYNQFTTRELGTIFSAQLYPLTSTVRGDSVLLREWRCIKVHVSLIRHVRTVYRLSHKQTKPTTADRGHNEVITHSPPSGKVGNYACVERTGTIRTSCTNKSRPLTHVHQLASLNSTSLERNIGEVVASHPSIIAESFKAHNLARVRRHSIMTSGSRGVLYFRFGFYRMQAFS